MRIYNKYKMFFGLVILISIVNGKEQYIESAFTKEGKCCYEVPLYFNSQGKKFDFEININKHYTGFTNFVVPEKCERRFYEQIEDFKDTSVEILQCFSKVAVNKEHNALNQFHFYLYEYNKNNINRKNIIGLSHNYKDNKLSIVHQLKEHELIEQLQFSIVHNLFNKSEGVLYYGGIPQETINNKMKISIDIFNTTNSFWNSKLYNIYFTGKEYKCDAVIYFSTSYYEIFVEFDYFTYLTNVLFLNEISNNKCTVKFNNGIMSILCDEYIKHSIGDIVFNIDKYYFTVKQNDLFNCDIGSDKCEFVLKFNSAMKGNEWLVGLVFIDNYDILFDIERKIISFYGDSSMLSNHMVEKINILNYIVLKKLLLLIILCLCICIIIILIFNYNKYK